MSPVSLGSLGDCHQRVVLGLKFSVCQQEEEEEKEEEEGGLGSLPDGTYLLRAPEGWAGHGSREWAGTEPGPEPVPGMGRGRAVGMRECCKLRSPRREPSSGTGKFMQGRSRKLGVNQEAEGQGRPSSPGLPPSLLSRCFSLPPPAYSRPVGSRSPICSPVALRGHGGGSAPPSTALREEGAARPRLREGLLGALILLLLPQLGVLLPYASLPCPLCTSSSSCACPLHTPSPSCTSSSHKHLHPLYTSSPINTFIPSQIPPSHPHTFILLQTPSYFSLLSYPYPHPRPSSLSKHLHPCSLPRHHHPHILIFLQTLSSTSKHLHPFILFLIPLLPSPPHPPPNLFIPSKILSSLSSYA